ncbi:transmembrane and immunoglobulin domain-containing protein 1 [Mantella aurantiaca]
MKYLLILIQLSFLFYQVRALGLMLNGLTQGSCLNLGVNQSQTISCSVANNSDAETLMWYREKAQVDIKSENSINISRICLPSVSPDDNGVNFTCLLKRDPTIKLSLMLNVEFQPLLSGDTKIISEEGKNVQITCGYKANPAAVMSWRQNNRTVTFPSRFEQRMTSDTWMLSITKAQMSDTANYTCVAERFNETEVTLTFELIVGVRKPGLPIEAIVAAVVVGALVIAFGFFARRQKICKPCMKSRNNTSM